MPQLQVTFNFLRQLAQNNNKAWFDAHRADYAAAKLQFEALLEDLIMNFGPVEDLLGMSPKDFTFRINRDVRFSNDKSPYKTNMAASLGRGGKKSRHLSYYLHVQPGESFIGGGIYMPEGDQLKVIRKQIDEDPREFKKIIANKDFVKYFGGLSGDKLKTAPKGYAPDHPEIELLRHKQFLAVHPLKESDVTSTKFVPHMVSVCKAMKPFNEYLSQLLGLA
jgi:uncharacterized protein (TIGR02453 family)